MSDTVPPTEDKIPDPLATEDSATVAPKQDLRTVKSELRRELFRTPVFLIGLFIVMFWGICAIVPSIFTKWGPKDFVISSDGIPLFRSPPQADAWFGTNTIGNDVFARIIYGARGVILTSVTAALLAVVLGSLLGLMMGYYRGWFDEIVGRIIEAFLSLPVILLVIMVVAAFGTSRSIVILTIAGLFTPVVARTIRSAVIAEAQLDYVTAAKLRGEPGMFIMTREILPNISGVAIVELTVRIAYAIFTVATLQFLGLGGDPTTADWGNDIAQQYKTIQAGQWWAAVFPGLAIASLVIGVNFMADSIEKVYRQ